jgi:hypothetical protein
MTDKSFVMVLPMLVGLLAVGGGALAEGEPGDTVGATMVSLACPQEVTAHEPIIGTMTIENKSPGAIGIDLGGDKTQHIAVRVSGGPSTAEFRTLPLSEGIQGLGRISIPAGRKYSQELLLNDWADFREPGVHVVTVRVPTPVAADSRGVLPAPQLASCKVAVQKRDEAVLDGTCRKFADDVMRSKSVARRHFVAKAIASMEDAIVVPCIGELLVKSDREDPVLFDALRRIASTDALGILHSYSTSADPERAALAASALSRVPSVR